MMKYHAFIFLPLLLANCQAKKISKYTPEFKFGSRDIAGIFTANDKKLAGVELALHDDSSFLYSIPNGRIGREWGCCDTIAYGNWAIEPNGMITLSSPDYLSKSLKVSVQEAKNEYLDTVYVRINNPIENYLSRERFARRNIQYGLGVLAGSSGIFLKQFYDPEASNFVKLYNPDKLSLVAIHVVVFAKPDYSNILAPFEINQGVQNAMTEIYDPQNRQANQFTITIPDLTDGYLNFRRLNRDFVKIISNKQLEWDGHIFIKKKSIAGQ